MARERWRKIRRAEGYKVSSLGRVRSVPRTLSDGREHGGQMLKPVADEDGYQRVTIAGHTVLVHTLVLEAFVGLRPDGMQACHGNGDRSWNDLSNLRWGTRLENEQDKKKIGNMNWKETHRPAPFKTDCPINELVTLTEYVAIGLTRKSITVLRKARARDARFPKPAGYRGMAQLYRAAELEAWDLGEPPHCRTCRCGADG